MKRKLLFFAIISMVFTIATQAQVNDVSKPLPLTSQTISKATLLSIDKLQAPEGRTIESFKITFTNSKSSLELNSNSDGITNEMKNKIKDYKGKELVIEDVVLRDDKGKQEKYPAVFLTLE